MEILSRPDAFSMDAVKKERVGYSDDDSEAKKARAIIMSLSDTEILDRISDVKAEVTESVGEVKIQVAALHTKMDTLISGKTRCEEHSRRLADIEQHVAADKRVRGFVFAALALGVPTLTAIVVALMGLI
ncbi:MAG: hypothetical protein WC262_10385 [Bacteroidales bacterium]